MSYLKIEDVMTIYTTTQARDKFFSIVDEVNEKHRPVLVKGKRHNAIIMSEEEYEGWQETLYIYSVPGWVERILEAAKEPIEECVSHEEAWK